MTQFNVRNAVWSAYWAVFTRLDGLVYFAVIWLAFGAVAVVLVPGILEQSLEGRTGFERVPPAQILALLGEAFVLVAASVCMSIAWYRWIVLGEPLSRVLPERTDAAAAYTWRFLVLMLVPLAVSVATIGVVVRNGGSLEDDSPMANAMIYILSALIMAALARCLPALAACAVGDRDLTFRASWRLTAGAWLPLFLGYLACDLPFNLTMLWLHDISETFVEESLAQSVLKHRVRNRNR